MVETWLYCISGFRQHEGEPNGMFRLWLKLHELACGELNICSPAASWLD